MSLMEYIKSFMDGVMRHPEQFSDMKAVSTSALEFYDELLKRIKEAGPEEVEEVKNYMLELQGQLADNLKNLTKDSNLSEMEVKDILANGSFMKTEDLSVILDMQKKINEKTSDFLGLKPRVKKETKKSKILA